MIKSVLWIAGVIVGGYLIILLLLYLFQTNMVYHPTKKLWTDPSKAGFVFEDVSFQSSDGLTLHGWLVPADSNNPTVLYCHGNAGNISGRMETIRLLHDLGLNVFIFDYRGYGQSEGSPSEQGTYNDALAAWNYLRFDQGLESDNIIVMGRSLGGSIASWLGARKSPAALIVESTFTSAADLANEIYPWLPVRQLIKYEYRTKNYIRKVKVPIFMAHSREDQVVPFQHGEALFKIAPDPKNFVELRGSHGTGFLDSGKKYREALQQFLETYTSLNPKVKN